MKRILLVLAAGLAVLPAVAFAALPATDAVVKGAAFIKTVQRPDGSYAESPGQSIDAIIAVRAAGYDPRLDLQGGKSPVDWLVAAAPSVTSPASAAKAALGAKALGLDPKNVGGTNLIAVAAAGYDATTGAYADNAFSQSIAILGLACTGNPVGAKAADNLKASAVEGGGWGFGGFADPDTTAIAIQALLAAGVPKTDAKVAAGLAWLRANQGSDGGWGYDPSASNTSSTAFAIQALLALGEDPESATYTKNGVTPVQYLLSQQLPDGSFVGYDPAFAANQVVPALAGRTFCNAPETPITRVRPAAQPTPTPTAPPASPTPQATTPAPRPPATGDSLAAPAGGSGALALALAGAALLATGAAAAAVARRRS
jgi:hypothetical protein